MWFKKKQADPSDEKYNPPGQYLYIRGSKVLICEFFDRNYDTDRFKTLCENITIDEFYNITASALDLIENESKFMVDNSHLSPFLVHNYSSMFDFLAHLSRHALEASDIHPSIDTYNREKLESISNVLGSFLEAMMAFSATTERVLALKKARESHLSHHEEWGFRSENWKIIHENGQKFESCFLDASDALSKDWR